MKVSFNWLREYVNCPLSPEELADRLTMHGLEVEAVTRLTPALKGIVVGRVLSVEPHPRADRLSVCRVSDGTSELTIVCGAKNVTAGDAAPLARVGVTLPNGTTIRQTALRGIASEGMLCSERELELGEDAEGIMILAAQSMPGQDLSEALQLNDSILDVNVTPNRPDCLSVVGVAREAAAILKKPLMLPRCRVKEKGARAASRARVSIEDGGLCPRYCARVVTNVSVGPSPFWLRNRLGAVGVRTINLIVDATNYVLMECGQPLHAFDLQKIKGGCVFVRQARRGEKITTIDGRERALDEGMLVIADSKAPLAVAGIMGGLHSEVGKETRELLLESACFKPQSIRRTSQRLNLSSESSYRFERGVDYHGLVPALDRAAQLISALGAGDPCTGVIDRRSTAWRARRVKLRIPRLNAVLGARLSKARVRADLERLGMGVREQGRVVVEVAPPAFRVDLCGEIDLVEEVARMEGYDRIIAVPPVGVVPAGGGDPRTMGREKVRDALCSLGFSEAICLSFMGLAEMDRLMWGKHEPLRRAVRLRNPVSDEFAYLRTSMLPPLMRCLSLNANRGNSDAQLFELGTVFSPREGGAPPLEMEKLALAAMGLAGIRSWCARMAEVDFFYLKGMLENMLTGAGAEISAARASLPGCHPGRSATLSRNGLPWGWIGEIHPRVAEAYGIKAPVIFAEVDPAPLYTALLGERVYRPLPRFPAVKRDIALVADEHVEAAGVIATVRRAVPGLIEAVELFDLFRGQQIPPGKKGLAVSVTLRAPEATLREEDIEAAMEKIREALREMGCEIR
ncbi:MAG: phenylalanine--tRNA ligase subunit beta [Candidatus Aureabacteria bacterium]|nr:phenylalanine--tRNA ligase subunit beta [Candidatus Auribacterota bacterium]